MKVAVVFDNQHRPETTGFYCRRALAKRVDVEHLLPHELPLIPPGLFDLFVCIDDGLDYEIPDSLRPRASWAIDTHMDFDRAVRRFGDSDFIFAAQKNGAALLSEQTGRPVMWLPLACDPEIHRPMADVTPCYDVGFVGHTVGKRRIQLLDELTQRYPQSIICQALFDEMATAWSRARVGFNCGVADDLNMRLFEVPAHRIPLVTNHVTDNGLEKLFTVGQHVLTYHDAEELFEIVDRLLDDDRLRRRIAEDGLRHVREHHTYDLRMGTMLQTIDDAQRKSLGYSKAVDYFEFPRPDVQALVPPDAQRILDVGCGAGALGAALKSQRDVAVTGIELNPEAATRAEARLNAVVDRSIDELPADHFPDGAFDCIVFADVLEHLRDPASVLKKCRPWLTENGSVVISIPNSRHHSVISGLIDGNWTYEKAGLLDEDHVRCFTRREIEKLLFRSGFGVEELRPIPGSGYQQWVDAGRPGEVQIGSLHMGGLSPEEAEEFVTYQYVSRARREVVRDYGLTSIVIVTWNQLAYTKECVDSILARTDEPFELIFVDNGSTDGTPDYLDTVPNAVVIRNAENRGYAPAVNQGLQVCRGQNICLLNNDCVVTTGWLDGLLEALHDDDSNGLVGPVSNNVSGEQQISIRYTDLTSMDGFAWDQRRHRELTLTDRLVGFCLLFRRDVMDRIGLLDEQFEIGCFEDDDFCRRATEAGYRAIIAQHVFVHHYGSATFRGAGFDLGNILQQNEQRYLAKWEQQDPISVQPRPSVTLEQSYEPHRLDNGECLLQRTNVRLSLCMIVRDNEDTIEACLDSIYPWVDEIIIVDTGSTDATPEICRRFGARMFEFPWCDDFSAARNVSLEPARGDWVFWMDSDDTIDQEQGRRLRELVYGHHDENIVGYVMQVHCPSSEPGQLTIVDHVKVFRNRPELRFEHRIHEQILPAIRRAGGDVAFTDIHVVHSGSDQTPDVRARKLERDFRILQRDLEERPDHPFVLFNLGMTHEDAGEYAEAEQCLSRCLEVSNEGESQLRKAWALLVNCQRMQGRIDDAIVTATQALQTYKGDKELLFRRAVLLQDAGRLEDARADYLRILEEPVGKVFQSIDPAICGHKAQHNLALVFQQLGQYEQAVERWRHVVADFPEWSSAWLSLGRQLVQLGRAAEIPGLFSRMPQHPDVTVARSIMEALVAEQAGNILDAQRILETAWRDTSQMDCLDELARMLVENGAIGQAIPVLEQLRSLRPNDAAVLHNLGSAYHVQGNESASVSCLQESVRLRPDAEATQTLLETVLAGSPG